MSEGNDQLGTGMVFWQHEDRWYRSLDYYDLALREEVAQDVHDKLVFVARENRQFLIDGEYPLLHGLPESSDPRLEEILTESLRKTDAYIDRRNNVHEPWVRRHAIFVDVPTNDPDVLKDIQSGITGITG